ncbi:MAG: hypothetical protein P8J51_05785 [Dehalococcoidia bacterium]|nr:hypothetical protein [Dehalococcoidia bacterium]
MSISNFTCQICKSFYNTRHQNLIPLELSIDFKSDESILLCEMCNSIKQNIDEHISKTSGEYHTVNNEYLFINFCEYWSDWASSLLDSQENNRPKIGMNKNKIWNTYSYANRMYNFSSKQEALQIMIESRLQYQKYLGIISFTSYQSIFKNITKNLLNSNEYQLSRHLSYVNTTLHNKITISEWLDCSAVNYFLNNTAKLF